MRLKYFLLYFGVLLFLLGVLGFFVLGPDAVGSVFGAKLFYSTWENWSLMILGPLIFVLALALPWRAMRWVALLYGGLFIFVGTFAFFEAKLWRLELQKPTDGIIYLVFGLVSLLAALLSNRPKNKVDNQLKNP